MSRLSHTCSFVSPLTQKKAIVGGKDQLRISKENKAEKGTLQIVEKEQEHKNLESVLLSFESPGQP